MISAIIRRSMGGSITQDAARIAIEDFDADRTEQYISIETIPKIIAVARSLVEVYALRGYDAIQLAMGLACNREQLSFGSSPITFVSADNELINAANSEGLSVENPNDYP